ncbi:MAG: radical SAM protein [Elusimicrobia bacterium]|nr:radical SAM protein [Elusimicrobiota bacterium]
MADVPARIAAELPALERIDRESFDEPKCFDILLNYNCSAKCLFCSQDFAWRKEPNDLPFEKAVEFMYMAYQNGYRRLGFTGGEPTLRPELPKLIALAKKIGYGYVRIQTNGIRIADYAYAKLLADAGLTFVKYSLHGHNAELHDKLVAVPGAFEKNLRSIENLKKLNVGIGVNIVLNDLNYRHLVEFYELFLLKLQLSNFVIIAPLYEGNMTLNDKEGAKIGARLTDMASYIRKAYELFTKINYPKPPLLLHFTPCVLPGYEQQMLGWSAFNTMVVNPKGEKRDLDMTAQSHTTKTAACQRCVYNDRCIGWDASYARVFGTDEITPLLEMPERYDAPTRGRPAHEGRGGVLTDNEQCVLEVLKRRNDLTTKQFLDVAESLPICKDCKDENAVMNAAETLIKMGVVERKFVKGKYLWSRKAEVPAA